MGGIHPNPGHNIIPRWTCFALTWKSRVTKSSDRLGCLCSRPALMWWSHATCNWADVNRVVSPSFTQKIVLNSGPHPWSLCELYWSHACHWMYTSLVPILIHWFDFLAGFWTYLSIVDLPEIHQTVGDQWYHYHSVLAPEQRVWQNQQGHVCWCLPTTLSTHLPLDISSVLLLLDSQCLPPWAATKLTCHSSVLLASVIYK